MEDILRPGSHVIAAGYCMYGSATEMVFSLGRGVHQFSLDPTIGSISFMFMFMFIFIFISLCMLQGNS